MHVQGDVPERDEIGERRLVGRLRDELFLVPGRRVDFDGQEANKFAAKLREFQLRLGGEPGAMLVRSAPVQAKIRINGDTLNIEFEVPPDADAPKGSEPRREKPALKPCCAPGKMACPWFRSKAAAGPPCPVIGSKSLATAWQIYSPRVMPRGRVSRVSIPALSALCDDLDQPRPPSFDKLAPLIHGFESLPEVELPKDLTATLRAYQKVGVDWLCFLRDAGLGAVLADDMGLGKTLQTLCAVSGRTLIVCPKERAPQLGGGSTPLSSWPQDRGLSRAAPRARQASRSDAHDLCHLAPRCRAASGRDLGHGRARRSASDQEPGQPSVARGVRVEANFPVALSGTPLENRLEELWSMFHFSHRGLALRSLAVSRSVQLAHRARQ